MSQERGRIAYEARHAGELFIANPSRENGWGGVTPWADLPDTAKATWARVEAAVLAAAHRIQIVSDVWSDDTIDFAPPGPAGLRPGLPAPLGVELEKPETQGLTRPGATIPIWPGAVATFQAVRNHREVEAGFARLSGFTGNACQSCLSFQMVRDGKCEKCLGCGTTSGGCT